MAETGYEDIETLIKNQNSMLDESLQKQQDITNKQTEMNVAELERNKEEVDKDATKTNKALYTEYQKAKNPYGANAEQLYSQGLGNSGYAETTQTNLYNNYQSDVTSTLNNARELKSDFDFQISKARQTGDITLAQNALEIYNQKMNLLTQEFELRNNREQFLYQQQRDKVSDNQWQQSFNYQKSQDNRNYNYQISRDKVSDSQWEKEYNYQKNRDKVSDSQWQKNYDYQKSRDAVSDSQWEKEYALSKKASASSSSKKSSSRTTSTVKSDTSKSNNSGSTIKDNSSSKATSSKFTELLKKAGEILANNTKEGKIISTATKATAKSLIYSSYKRGDITEEQAGQIFDKLGL